MSAMIAVGLLALIIADGAIIVLIANLQHDLAEIRRHLEEVRRRG